MTRPTIDQLKKALGDPTPYILRGTTETLWPKRILGTAYLPAALPLSWDRSVSVSRFSCHKLLVPFFEAALHAIAERPEAWATVNDFGGCYAFRPQRGTRSTLSLHAWGAAIDLDVCDNPMGKDPDVHPLVIEAFARQGFVWGGTFQGKRRDGMHFEFADLQRL